MRGFVLGFVAMMCGSGVGCSHARYIHRGQDEGVVAIPNRSNEWPTYNQDKANRLIIEHVGPDYEVVEEWSEKTGQQVLHDQNSKHEATFNSQMPFMPAEQVTTRTNSSVSDITEWRIRYRKRTPISGGFATGTPTLPPNSSPIQPVTHSTIVPPVQSPPPPALVPIATTPPPAVPVLPAP